MQLRRTNLASEAILSGHKSHKNITGFTTKFQVYKLVIARNPFDLFQDDIISALRAVGNVRDSNCACVSTCQVYDHILNSEITIPNQTRNARS